MAEPGRPEEFPSAPTDADQVILEKARKLVSSNATDQHALHVSGEGAVLAEDLVKLAKDADQVSLSDIERGDVVWWQTESGTSGYFVLKEPYVKTGDDPTQARDATGEFLITRKPGHPLGDQRGPGKITGATLGGMLKKGAVLKGTGLEYKIQVGDKEKPYTTTPVTGMGVIKAGQLG